MAHEVNKHEHKFIFIESIKRRERAGHNDLFRKIDRFFCERCLETREVEKHEYSRDIPDWY